MTDAERKVLVEEVRLAVASTILPVLKDLGCLVWLVAVIACVVMWLVLR